MMRRLIRFCVHHPRVILALSGLIMVLAVFEGLKAGLDIFPEFSAPRVVIQTEAFGLSAEQTETLVTRRIEKSLAGVMGLEVLRSESIQGLSVVTALFEESSDPFRNRQLVAERLGLIAAELPEGTAPPVMLPLSSSSATVLTIGLSTPTLDLMSLRDLVDYRLTPQLMAIPGISDVNVFGGEVRQLQIHPDLDRLRQFGLTLQDVLDAAQDATGMAGAGFIETDNQRLTVEISGLPNTAESLSQVVLRREGGRILRLGEIATVREAPKPPIGGAEINGAPGIVVMLIAQRGANTLTVSKAAESVLTRLKKQLEKQNIQLSSKLFRPADYIERSVEELSVHLLSGAILVLVILYAFLRNLRISLIPVLAIPLSLLGAILILRSLGIPLNIMVLGGLAISLGEVVDDAIIDTENIFRRLRQRLPEGPSSDRQRGVLSASLEIRGSVTYASFIVALVFVPLILLEGISGRLFGPLGLAYICAILCSLLTALTVTPALCALALVEGPEPRGIASVRTRGPQALEWLQGLYQAQLQRMNQRALRWILWPLAGTLMILACLPLMGGDFLPRLREGHYIVHTTSLPGTSLTESLRTGHRLVHAMLAIPGVESVSQWAGRAERGADTFGSHYSEYEVRLLPQSGSEQDQVLKSLRSLLGQFPGLLSEVNTFLAERIEETVSGYTAPVVINLYGEDLDRLDSVGAQLLPVVRAMRGARDVQLRSPSGTPVTEISLNLESLGLTGLRPLELARTLQGALRGTTVAHYYQNSRSYDVSIILAEGERSRLDRLNQLPFRTSDGQYVELGQVADLTQISRRYNILHRNGQRVQTLTAAVEDRDLDDFFKELKARIEADIELPEDIVLEYTGTILTQAEARTRLLVNAGLAAIGVLLLLGLAIGRTRNVLLTLANLPFALSGGLLAIWLSEDRLSVGALVGFVTLFGITVRNAIMLASHYRHLTLREGHPWNFETALMGASDRLPAILMTALVTGFALLPIAVHSDNPGREILGPMAAVIIGGLFSSTALSLLVLPLLYARFGDFRPRRGP